MLIKLKEEKLIPQQYLAHALYELEVPLETIREKGLGKLIVNNSNVFAGLLRNKDYHGTVWKLR